MTNLPSAKGDAYRASPFRLLVPQIRIAEAVMGTKEGAAIVGWNLWSVARTMVGPEPTCGQGDDQQRRAGYRRPMRPLAGQERAARWVDWLIALALAGWAQYEIWVQPLFQGDDGIPGPRPINAALFMLITVPLAWRRRAPLTVVSIVAAAATVQAVFFDHSTQPSTQLWLAVLIALYSVAAHGQRRDALLGGALVAAGTLAIDIRHLAAGERTLAEIAGEWALFAGVWLLGRYVHRWRLRARQQQERADQLELDHEERARAAVAAGTRPDRA